MGDVLSGLRFRSSQKVELEPLVVARKPPTIPGAEAEIPRPLRPLPSETRIRLSDALQRGDGEGAEAALRPYLPHIGFSLQPAVAPTTFVGLIVEPGRVRIEIEPGLRATCLAYKYHRVADMAPFLNYVAERTTVGGAVDLELSDAGSAEKLGFSSIVPAPLLPDCAFFASAAYDVERTASRSAADWNDRADTVLWRGSTTGPRTDDWRTLQRARLCEMAQERPSDYDVGFSSVLQAWRPEEAEEIRSAGLMRPHMSPLRFADYKYHIDIDGNTNAWGGFFIKLLLGGLVFKVDSQFGHRQWYYNRLQPWLHYVPIDATLSDLHEKMVWARENVGRSRQIAEAGFRLAQAMTLEHEAAYGLAVVEGELRRRLVLLS